MKSPSPDLSCSNGQRLFHAFPKNPQEVSNVRYFGDLSAVAVAHQTGIMVCQHEGCGVALAVERGGMVTAFNGTMKHPWFRSPEQILPKYAARRLVAQGYTEEM